MESATAQTAAAPGQPQAPPEETFEAVNDAESAEARDHISSQLTDGYPTSSSCVHNNAEADVKDEPLVDWPTDPGATEGAEHVPQEDAGQQQAAAGPPQAAKTPAVAGACAKVEPSSADEAASETGLTHVAEAAVNAAPGAGQPQAAQAASEPRYQHAMALSLEPAATGAFPARESELAGHNVTDMASAWSQQVGLAARQVAAARLGAIASGAPATGGGGTDTHMHWVAVDMPRPAGERQTDSIMDTAGCLL